MNSDEYRDEINAHLILIRKKADNSIVGFAEPHSNYEFQPGTDLFGTPAILTAQLTTVTFTAPTTPDYAITDLTDTGGFGFASKDEGNSALSVIANLQIRLAALETKLKAIGILA